MIEPRFARCGPLQTMNNLCTMLRSTFDGAVSSAVRASRLHREGRRFNPFTAHQGLLFALEIPAFGFNWQRFFDFAAHR